MKFLKDLSREELRKAWENSSKFREDCFSAALENEDFFISEIMDHFKKNGRWIASFNIDACSYSYMRVSRDYYTEFVEAVVDLQNMYCILPEELNLIVPRLEEKAEFYHDAYSGYMDISKKNWEMLDDWFSGNVQEIANEIVSHCIKSLDYWFDDENVFNDYLLEFALEEYYSDFLVSEDYVIFQHVDYMKDYA